MSKQDYYQLLGVQKNSSAQEIKKAYRKLAMKYHPDRNQGDEQSAEKFKEIQEAYAVLSDDQKRQAYDQFGHAGVDGQMGGGGAGGFGFGDIGDIFGDMFGEMFGGGGGGRSRGRQSAQRGSDLAFELVLTLEEAMHGVTKEIKVPSWVSCGGCNGSGAKKGSGPVRCGTCDGTGQVRQQSGFLAIAQTCRACGGRGQVIKDPCYDCHGQGRIQKRKTLSVKVPAGVDTGDRVRLSGEGEAGMNGAPAGDLYVQMRIKEHKLFKRDGEDLYCDVPVSFATTVLGGEIEVPTLQGKVKLTIPEETQTNKMFRLRGKGIKSLRGSAVGDLLCRIIVETPVKLSEEQKQLLRDFDSSVNTDGKDHRPKAKNWFDSVKNFFKQA